MNSKITKEGQLKKVLLLILVLPLVACHRVTPDAGQQAVLIAKPYFFGHGGVIEEPVTTGSSFVWWSTQHVMVNMQPQQGGLHFEDLMTSDGVPLDFDAILRYRVTDSVRLIRDFGEQWYINNLVAEASNRVRQAVRKHGMNETAIQTTAIDSIDAEVTTQLVEAIRAANLPIELLNFTVGKANPPDSIENQRVETAAQEQRANTEKQRKLAEDQRKAAETSRAEADNAYRVSMSLSPEQFVALEQIKATRDVCIGGKCTLIVGNGLPIIQAR